MSFCERAQRPQWGGGYLKELATACLAKVETVEPRAINDLRGWLANGTTAFSWGSGCSGTDAPQWSFEGIKEALRDDGLEVTVVHKCSAEKDSAKRKFIQQVATPEILAGDVFDLSAQHCWDYIGERWIQPLAWLMGVLVFIAGFVCKSVSSLNNDWKNASKAVWEKASKTGSTFLAVLLFVQTFKPPCVILENVFGLMRNQQHLSVMAQVGRLGYAVVCFKMSPKLDVGFPHDRPRLYFLGVRLSGFQE